MIPTALLRLWCDRSAPWAACGLAVAGLLVVTLFVDVSPRVEGEFFFADDDPQMEASRLVRERFPAGQQLILRVADLEGAPSAYVERVGALTEDLLQVDGVLGGFSVATNDPDGSPLYGRILLTRDERATNVILDVDRTDPEVLLPRIEQVVERHESPELHVVVSGVPAIVELIRRSLNRDLFVFSLSAIVVFAMLIGVVYRDLSVVVGTLATCFVSVALTLVVVQAMSVPIGLLTANLVTIVFVLTLSHVVFLTANWKAAAAEEGAERPAALAAGVRRTLEGSFWSMATTLLGFLSLLVATARPLRELGVAGAVGTVTALIVAYGVYPAFLGRWASVRPSAEASAGAGPVGGARALAPIAAVVALLGLGVAGVDTDPGLLSYFSADSEIREGLDEIDADGGTSTLDVVVADREAGRVDTPATFAALTELQERLEADSAVGVVLSPTVLVEQGRTLPLAGLLPVATLLDIASSERLGGVALGFVTPERDQARFSLRMRESLGEERSEVLGRVWAAVEGAGLEPVAVAGLYELQLQLGRLIASSLRIGIGGLLLLFLGVAWIVSRSPALAIVMWVCLVAIPTVILGAFGHLGIAVDIITSPAANIALAIGADSMIHMVVRYRILAAAGDPAAWSNALAQIGRPVLGASGIICAGFGIFVLSSFPPTQRFGLAVIFGTVAAATMALVALPRLGSLGRSAAAS